MGTIDKAFLLLREIANAGGGTRHRDLVVASRLPPASVHRLLASLERHDIVRRDKVSRRYRIGGGLVALANAARAQFPLVTMAEPILSELSRKTGVTSYLSVASGLDAVCLLRVEGQNAVRAVMLQPGMRRPLGLGAGSVALLAALGAEEAERAIAANAEQVDAAPYDAAAVRALLASARAAGTAQHSGQLVPGVDGIGAAAQVMGVPAAISVSFVGSLVGQEARDALAGDVRRSMDELVRTAAPEETSNTRGGSK